MDTIYIVAEPLRSAHRTSVRLASRFLRASYLAPLSIITVAVPMPALAAAPRTFSELASLLVTIIDSAAGLLVVAGIVIYFFSVSTSIYKVRNSEDASSRLRTLLMWGVLILFIMVSIWGILQLLQNTLFSGDRYNPSTGNDSATPSFSAPVYTGE